MVFFLWALKTKTEEWTTKRAYRRLVERDEEGLRGARRDNTGCAFPSHIELLEQHHCEHSAPSSGKSGDYPTIRRSDYSTNPRSTQNAGKAKKDAR